MAPSANDAVLVLGVYLLDRENTAAAVVGELSRSQDWRVEHRWAALGERPVPDALGPVTVARHARLVPKFVVLNQLLSQTPLSRYAYVVVCDDDVALPSGFLDEYLRLVQAYDLALAQPALASGSYISHPFVARVDGLAARQTKFVEIGPLFSMRRDAATLLTPFDEASPMGWGYDFVWPQKLAAAGLKLGVVDAVPIVHTRPVAAHYSAGTARREMTTFLRDTPHLSAREAFSVEEAHPGRLPAGNKVSSNVVRRQQYWALDRVRRTKQALVDNPSIGRFLIPFSDTVEVWLTDGFREVVRRARGRILGRPATADAIRAEMTSLATMRGSVTIPPRQGHGGVSIVIPVLNKITLTMHCLRSVVEHSQRGLYEVIVVDNGSDELTREALSQVQGLRVIRNDTNAGFVAACNQGAAAAEGEYLLFLNNDTLALPGWLDALTETLQRNPDVGAVGSKLIYPNGRLQEAGGIIWRDGSGWNYGRNQDPDSPEYCYLREVDYCSGACLMVRRSLFETLGGFDSRFAPAYYEDADLCFRLREHGYRVLYQPASEIVHLEGATAGTDISTGFKKYQAVNHRTFVARHQASLAFHHPPDARLVHAARDRRAGKRVLVVDHMLPHHDEDAGSVRMSAILRILVEFGHRVTFLPHNMARIEPYARELQQSGVEVLYGPMSAGDYLDEHLPQFDVAILSRAHFAKKYVPAILESEPQPFLVFDTVDLHHLREQRLADLSSDPAAVKAAEETRAVEMSVMRASDMVWVTSTHEAEVLRAADSSLPLEIVPTIHEARRVVPGYAGRRDLLFIGSFRHPPNEDAVLYFIRDIFPRVTAAIPGIRLHIVGPHVPPSILDLASADIDVMGYVKDLAPLFDACRLSVAPLTYGAGVKGKISQSLAWGLPVVTTPIGAEGMNLVDGEHVLIGTSPAQFADHVAAIYQDEELWTKLSINGRRHVETHLGYETARTKIDAVMKLAGRSSERRAQRLADTTSVRPPMDDVVYGKGFGDLEGANGSTWRWMGSEGVIRLRNTGRPMRLTIAGGAPGQLIGESKVRLAFEGETLDEILATESIEKTYDVSVSRQGSGRTSELRITTDRTFVPCDTDPLSSDRRRLGFAVYRVGWNVK